MHLVEVAGMSRKAKWNSSHAIYEIRDQSRVMRKMSMQVVYLFFRLTLPCQEQVYLVHGQSKAFPAVAGVIPLVNLWMGRDINQGAQVSQGIAPGDLNMLSEPVSQAARLDGFV